MKIKYYIADYGKSFVGFGIRAKIKGHDYPVATFFDAIEAQRYVKIMNAIDG